jgi:hypothetical protein
MSKKSFIQNLGLSETVTTIKEKLHAGASGALFRLFCAGFISQGAGDDVNTYFRRTSGVADVIVVEHNEGRDSLGSENNSHDNVNRFKYTCSDFVAHGIFFQFC